MTKESSEKQRERREAKAQRRAESKRRYEARRQARGKRDARLAALHAKYVADVAKVWQNWRSA